MSLLPGRAETLVVVSYIPNLLTVLRIVATPVLIILLKYEMFSSALMLFVLAGVSDGLDGYIAKRFRSETRLGAILDPVADKVLLVSCFIVLTVMGHLPFWLLLVVAFRDIVIVGGYLLLVTLEGGVRMDPSRISKLNTVFQICLITMVLVKLAAAADVAVVIDALIALVTLTSILSGAHYVWIWAFRRHDPAVDTPSDTE
jgi:cardiolipin synthase